MSQPLVSVVIPCYNSAAWIRDAIGSCLAQTYQPLDIVVVNDGSTDNSVQIIEEYGQRVRLVSIANGGLSAARNFGMSVARGEYIQFLDADDYLLPEKIAHQATA